MTDQRKPFDRLMEEQRIVGGSRMILDATCEVTREVAQAVIDQAQAFIKKANVSAAYVARQLGIAASTLSQVFNWKYAGDWQSIVIDLDRWVDDERRREEAPTLAEFVPTGVAQEIHTVASLAVEFKTIALIYGPTGVGKTLALRAVAEEIPGSVYVSMESNATSPLGVLEGISRAMRVDPGMGCSQRIIANRLKHALSGTSRLLIIDEIHKLTERQNDTSFHVLRDLFDHTQAPQLWAGTTNLITYFQRGEGRGREPLAQIRRRIGIRRDLTQRTRGRDGGRGEPLFGLDEVRAIFRKAKMKLAPDAAKYLTDLANLTNSGGLGACFNVMRMAMKINQSKASIVTAEMLRSAQGLLLQDRECDLLASQIELQAGPLVKVG